MDVVVSIRVAKFFELLETLLLNGKFAIQKCLCFIYIKTFNKNKNDYWAFPENWNFPFFLH